MNKTVKALYLYLIGSPKAYRDKTEIREELNTYAYVVTVYVKPVSADMEPLITYTYRLKRAQR